MLTLVEHVLLLEYDHDKTWAKHGERILDRMGKDYGLSRDEMYDGKEFFDKHSRAADPTPHREYGQWIAHHYANGGINRIEDFESRVHPALERFHDAKRRGQLKQLGISADINQHGGLPALEDVVDKLPHVEKEYEKPEPHEYDKVEDEHWTHITPHTEKASKYYGRGTRWCTAADKHCMFDDYNDTGNLHIMIPKKAKHVGEKYQYHVPSNSFMDEKDEPVNSAYGSHESPGPLHDRPSRVFNKHMDNILNGEEGPHVVGFAANHGTSDHVDEYLMQGHHLSDNTDPWESEQLAMRMDSDQLKHFVHSPEVGHRTTAAMYGGKEHHDVLVNDPVASVRTEVAAFTKHEPHLVQLAKDPNGGVKRTVLRRAAYVTKHKAPLDILANDEAWSIRRDVAHDFPYKEHVVKLANDEDNDVREMATHRLQYPNSSEYPPMDR